MKIINSFNITGRGLVFEVLINKGELIKIDDDFVYEDKTYKINGLEINSINDLHLFLRVKESENASR